MKKTTAAVLIRLFFAVIFAALIVLLKWEYFQWGYVKIRLMNTPFYYASIIFVYALLFSAIIHPLKELYRNKRIPVLQGTIERWITGTHRQFSKLGFQFIFWGACMLLLIGLAWNLGLLRDREYRLNQVPIPWRGIGTLHGRLTVIGSGVGSSHTGSAVSVFNYYSRDNDQGNYLRNCAKIVRDLNAAGAKLIFVPIPSIWSKEMAALLDEIHESGNVVFGVVSESNYYLAELRNQQDIRFGRLPYDVHSRNPFTFSFIHQINPFPASMGPRSRQNAHDFSLEILRMYRGLPPDELMVQDGDELVFGKTRYPLDDKGMLNVGGLVLPDLAAPVNAGFGVDWFPDIPKNPRLEYSVPRADRKTERPENLLKYTDIFQDKIVLMNWSDLGGLSGYSFSFAETLRRAQIVDDLVQGRILRQSNIGSLLTGLLAIVGCGLILYRSRLISSVAALILFSFVLLYGSVWLFQEKQILVDIPIAIASLVVSIAVFSVLRLGHEWRLGFRPNVLGLTEQPHPILTTAPGMSLFRRRVSISPVLAGGITVLIVIITALIAGSVRTSRTDESPKEVIYITSLPTVEVQGLPATDKVVKQ